MSTWLFDAGPDFRQQMLREHVTRLDAIILTHEHKRSYSGLDDVRAFNYKSQGCHDIFCEERVQKVIKRIFLCIFRISVSRHSKMRLNPVPEQRI